MKTAMLPSVNNSVDLSNDLVNEIANLSGEELEAAYARLPASVSSAEREVENLKTTAACCLFEMNELQSRAELGLVTARELDLDVERLKFERTEAMERLVIVSNSIETLKLTLKEVSKNINLRRTNERERKNDWLQSYAIRNIAEAEIKAVEACALVVALRGFKERRHIGTELQIMPLSAIESMLVRHCGGRQGTAGIHVFAKDLEEKIVHECEMQQLNEGK